MQNYAVYVRVSTDRDEQVSSVENQIDICRNWLERNNFTWDEDCVFKDEGISGTMFIDRPSIQLILEKAKRKNIDMVIFKSISRLARDLKDSLEIREVFLASGVRIISVEEGYDSLKAGKNDMAFELWSLFSAQYSRTLSSGISAALAAKVRRGEHIGKVPYGYNRENHKLIINEKEAEAVRLIYEWYNNGLGFKAITNELNKLGVKSKNNAVWQVTTIQRIVRNTIYMGTFILNQYSTIKVDGRKKQIRNPPEKWILFPNHLPPIISKDEWDKANEVVYLGKKTRITPWNEFRYKAVCGECGSNMVILQSQRKKKNGEITYWKYLKCSQYRRSGKYGCVNHVPIQYDDFRAFILNLLIKKGEHLEINLARNVQTGKQKREAKLRQLVATNEKRKVNLLELFLDGLISKEEFEKKRTNLVKIIEKTKEELSIHNKEETIEHNIQSVKEAFQELKKRNQGLFDVFQTLIEEIVIHSDGTIDIAYTFEEPK